MKVKLLRGSWGRFADILDGLHRLFNWRQRIRLNLCRLLFFNFLLMFRCLSYWLFHLDWFRLLLSRLFRKSSRLWFLLLGFSLGGGYFRLLLHLLLLFLDVLLVLRLGESLPVLL